MRITAITDIVPIQLQPIPDKFSRNVVEGPAPIVAPAYLAGIGAHMGDEAFQRIGYAGLDRDAEGQGGDVNDWCEILRLVWQISANHRIDGEGGT